MGTMGDDFNYLRRLHVDEWLTFKQIIMLLKIKESRT